METVYYARPWVISENVLAAVLDEVSGMSHRYTYEIKGKYCRVIYSNPDEYGTENPMTAWYPAYLGYDFGGKIWYIVLNIQKVTHDYPDGEGYQNFFCIEERLETLANKGFSWQGDKLVLKR